MTLAGRLLTLARKGWDWLRGRKPKPKPEPTPPPDPVRRAFRWPWWLVLVVLAHCGMPTEPLAAVNPEWVAGYHEAEACSGRSGDVTRVRWHVVADSSAWMDHGRLAGFRDGDDIYLAESWALDRWVARHESLHQLGFRRHDPELFGVRCGALWTFIRDTLGEPPVGPTTE